MATRLKKAVIREVDVPSMNKTLIITLKPGGMVGIREKKKRTEYEVSVAAIYWLGAAKYAEEHRKRKYVKRQIRRSSIL